MGDPPYAGRRQKLAIAGGFPTIHLSARITNAMMRECFRFAAMFGCSNCRRADQDQSCVRGAPSYRVSNASALYRKPRSSV